ncbi:MAG: hypothetical protein AAFX87_19240 [Bacteroidota bacterium]
MIKTLLLCCMCLLPYAGIDDINSTEGLIHAMHQKYKGKWFDQFTFIQETVRYNEDGTERDKAVWYEAIDYPNNFRIDFGEPKEGNAVLFSQDSAYRFREGQFQNARFEPQEFLLMKGGLYHYDVSVVMERLQEYGYDTKRFRKDVHNERPVFVVGADQDDLKSKQFWFDQEHLYMVRRIYQTGNGRTLDVQYSGHKRYNGGWVEHEVRFYVDGKYRQLEIYKSIDADPGLDARIFDPQWFGKAHWKKD